MINGLALPAEFVVSVRQAMFRRKQGCWELIQDTDAYGLPLETDLTRVYEDEHHILEETQKLTRDFPPDGLDGSDPSEDMPGFIPYITDFSKIVCFGVSGEDAPFCFDYRADARSPGIIWWEDAFWRRVAPDWVSFITLFDLSIP